MNEQQSSNKIYEFCAMDDLAGISQAVKDGLDVNKPLQLALRGQSYALIEAFMRESFTVAKFLVEAGADTNSMNADGFTPLSAAAYMQSMRDVIYLFEHGAEVDEIEISDGFIEEFEDGSISSEELNAELEEFISICSVLHKFQIPCDSPEVLDVAKDARILESLYSGVVSTVQDLRDLLEAQRQRVPSRNRMSKV